MSIARPFLPLFVAALIGCALAQPTTTVERPAFDVRFEVPADWVGEVIEAEASDETLGFTAPDDAGVVVVMLGRLTDRDRAELDVAGPAALWDAWETFAAGMPDVRLERERVRNVAGVEAGVLDYVGDGIRGSLIGAFGSTTGVIVLSIAVEGVSAVPDGLETLLSSFAFGAATGTPGAGNPLAPPAQDPTAANPLAPTARNPLAPPAAPAAPVSPGAPVYHEPFTTTDPASAFGGVLDVGFDGTWTGTLTGSAYRLTNDAAPDAVRYYYVMDVPGEAGPLAQGTIGVTLGLAPGGELAAAGLLFDFDPSDGSYLAFALTPTGYMVLQRRASGLEVLATEDLDTLRSDGRNRLELRAAGSSVEVLVNGASAATLNAEWAFSGGVGIVAVGAGAFEFQDFRYQRP